MKKLKIAYVCQFPGYENDFIFRLIKHLHASGVEQVSPKLCDLLIVGPFAQKWLGLRLKFRSVYKLIMAGRRYAPRTLYQTGENTRWNAIPADFSISSDLGVSATNHFRFPLWMSMFDWTHEGFTSKGVDRFGPLVKIDQLLRPLGPQKGRRAQAVLISSHLKEPRVTLLNAVKSVMEVDCYGEAFASLSSRASRDFLKVDVCRDKQFALCPENSLYPGYYTEKIPDAFACGCIPITWCDGNVCHDFNPNAIINMARYAATGYAEGLRAALEPKSLEMLRDQPLLLNRPTLDGIKAFLTTLLADLTS